MWNGGFAIIKPHCKDVPLELSDFIKYHLVDQQLICATPASLFSSYLLNSNDAVRLTVVFDELIYRVYK